MSKESLLLRLLASEARVDAHKFRTGHMNRDDWRKITGSALNLGEAPLWIDDSASSTVLEMGAKARRLKRDRGLSLMIVDYLQLVVPSNIGTQSNRQEEVSGMSRALKGLAKELRVPIVVLSQLTRAPEREERKPQLADLRESGAIEQDADVVMFINRPNFYKTDLAGRRPRQSRTDHRQAAQWPHRNFEFRVSWPATRASKKLRPMHGAAAPATRKASKLSLRRALHTPVSSRHQSTGHAIM